MPATQYRNFCFTINNPGPDDDIVESPLIRYCVYQMEQGEEGTPHIQGYVEFTKRMTFAAVKLLFPRAHLEARRGTREQARDYCMKLEGQLSEPVEIGDFATDQGKRTDLADACALVKEHGPKRVAQEMPEVFAKFHRGLHALAAALEEPIADEGFVPRPWQQKVLDIVTAPADDRTIVWVKDTVGNSGKSRLAVHLQRNHGACQLSGRIADMAYMYEKEPIVVIDVPRTQAENMDHLYAFAESLKNGVIVSTKYESRRKMFKPPHVIFFCNFSPDTEKWSADRLKLLDLQCPDTVAVPNLAIPPAAFW